MLRIEYVQLLFIFFLDFWALPSTLGFLIVTSTPPAPFYTKLFILNFPTNTCGLTTRTCELVLLNFLFLPDPHFPFQNNK